MGLTRSLLRAEALRDEPPVSVLRSVNRVLLDMNDSQMFVTLSYGVLDAGTREFCYARAGHELPLMLDTSGVVGAPERRDGQPLGLLAMPLLEPQKLTIGRGCVLLLFTDGVTDAMDEHGEPFGKPRLRAALAATAGQSAQAVCDALYHNITAYRGSAQQHDDVTLLAVRAL
jgi:sigma-B regulation protein RsbU (phosphoserine phosphatase)